MSEIEPLLRWGGSDAMVSLYGVLPASVSVPDVVAPGALRRRRPFLLEQEAAVLPGRVAYVWDLIYRELPGDLNAFFGELLRGLCNGGATVAWLAFEGGFSFEYLLSPNPAAGVYGVCWPQGDPVLALTEVQWQTAGWAATLSLGRAHLGIPDAR